MKYLFFVFLVMLPHGSAFSVEELRFGVSISTSAQREAFYTVANQFEEANPGIKVRFKAFTSEVYKERFPQLLNGEESFDVLYWHSGQRLFDFVEQDLISSLSALWGHHTLSEYFDQSVIETITFEQDIYAIPISYYQIGFYYSKPVFGQLGLKEPETWEEFMQVCRAIKDIGTAPIFIGSASNWPATAWFDYLNIRINGLAYHRQVTQGKIPFTDSGIKKVFEVWLQPIEEGCFINKHEEMTWREGLPFLYRDLVGMSMIGNYVLQDLPESSLSKLGFFAFPRINEEIALYEEAPVDILLIPNSARNKALAEKFMLFVSQSDIQSQLNKTLGVLSPHRQAQADSSPLVAEAYEVLANAQGVSHFFDRDASKEFADRVMPLLDEFMLNKDVKQTQLALEEIRADIFK